MRRQVLSAACLMLTLLCAVAPVGAQGISDVPGDDPAMLAAIAKAQATLPAFLAKLERPAPGEENFTIKIRYTTTKGTGEHIWAVDVERDGDLLAATIDNAPRDIPDLRHGQRVKVPLAQISDWFYFRDGKLHGGQTIRALLPTMAPREANKFRAMLAPE